MLREVPFLLHFLITSEGEKAEEKRCLRCQEPFSRK